MNFNPMDRVIYYVRHGSFAYGLNVVTSDEDFKGVCVKPREAYFGFTQRFEQQEHMGSKSDGIDSVIYSLDKFAHLAADCNPNIIEILHVADEDVLKTDGFGEQLRSMKDDFLSKKAKFTFSGYAYAQLKRIKSHRAWLLNPPKCAPDRKDYHLLPENQVSKTELGAFDSLTGRPSVDDTPVEQAVEETIAAVQEKGIILSKDIIALFTREKAFQAAMTHYNQFLSWKKLRNPARAELEAKYSYDTKHGMHLLRLQMMCCKILKEHKVHVKWTGPERDLLMAVRQGGFTYDDLVEKAETLDKESEALYETSTLRREANRAKLDEAIVDMTARYLFLHG